MTCILEILNIKIKSLFEKAVRMMFLKFLVFFKLIFIFFDRFDILISIIYF
jgi:hypothetical protein